jgi:hypothetical protein
LFKPSGRPLLDCGVMVYHANGILSKEAVCLVPYVPIDRNRIGEELWDLEEL